VVEVGLPHPKWRKGMSTKKDVIFELSPDIQSRVIGGLLVDEYILTRFHRYVKPEYFENPIHKEIVKFIIDYYAKHKTLTDVVELNHFLKTKVSKTAPQEVVNQVLEQIAKNTNIKNFGYAMNIIVKFARDRAIRNATINHAKLLKKGKAEEAKRILDEAYKVGLEEEREVESVVEFLRREVPEREVFVQNWAERKRLTILGGREKVGKSLIVIDMMIHLAVGENFLELNVPEPRRVLYVQQELAEIDLQNRLKKMLPEEIPNNLFHKTTTGAVLKIDNPDHRQIIHNDIEEIEPDLVVFDPYQTFHTKRENSNEDMNAVLDYFYEIIHRYNCGVFLIHHFSKPGEVERTGAHQFRGAGALGDRPDILICMNRLDKKYMKKLPLDYDDYVELSFDLRSDVKPLNTIAVRDTERLQYAVTEIGEQISKVTAENVSAIVKAAGGEVEQKIVMEGLTEIAGYNAASDAIKNADRKGYITKFRLPGRGGPMMLKLKK
jgi:hypothetical protein